MSTAAGGVSELGEEQRAQLALMPSSPPTCGATLSPCGVYRYRLWRNVVSFHTHHVPGRVALFIMLNPSQADENADDPTIRRCVSFATREGCGRLEVVNLYAFRATEPREMFAAHDPVGPFNDEHIALAVHQARASGGLVIVAFGADPRAWERWERVRCTLDGGETWCFGTTKSGQPRHPLFVRRDEPLARWT